MGTLYTSTIAWWYSLNPYLGDNNVTQTLTVDTDLLALWKGPTNLCFVFSGKIELVVLPHNLLSNKETVQALSCQNTSGKVCCPLPMSMAWRPQTGRCHLWVQE